MIEHNQPAIKHKLGLLELAEQLRNVSRACKLMGVSRDTFYRVQTAYEDGGIDALLAKSKKTPNPKNRVEEHVEKAILDMTLENPAKGQLRASNDLRQTGVFVSSSGVRSVWQPPQPGSLQKRLKALEETDKSKLIEFSSERLVPQQSFRRFAPCEIQTWLSIHPGKRWWYSVCQQEREFWDNPHLAIGRLFLILLPGSPARFLGGKTHTFAEQHSWPIISLK